jgi:hypothetical protein
MCGCRAGGLTPGGGSFDAQGVDETDLPDTNPSGSGAEAGADSTPAVDGGGFDQASESGSSSTSDAAAGRSQSVYMTFYGWPDNTPPGNAIAYPKSGGFPTVHDVAGGTGTFSDPITFATDKAEFPPGTLLYAPIIDKYLVMEDDCVQCDSDWSSARKWHIDAWMNSSAAANGSAVQSCEGNWTQSSTSVEISPPPGRLVTTAPLFDITTNSCRTSP